MSVLDAVTMLGTTDASTVVPWIVMGSIGYARGGARGVLLKLLHRREAYDDGSTFSGQIRNGRRNGRGTWVSEDEWYEGEWQEDRRHGEGFQSWKDGRTYRGQFRHGKFEGHGRMEWLSSEGLASYEGQYMDDLKHGAGVYRWADGRAYDGDWSCGLRHGEATYLHPRGDPRRGTWRNDRLQRWEEPEALLASV